MLLMLLAACTGGPDNNENVNETPSSDFVVTPEGIYLEGTESITMDFSVWIGEDSTTCRVNIDIETADGLVSGEIFTSEQTTFEVPKGSKVFYSAGEDEEKYLTSFDEPTHVDPETGAWFFSIETSETFTSNVAPEIDLTWYLRDKDENGDEISYYCYKDSYLPAGDDWELDEDDEQISGGPFFFHTKEDGVLDGDYNVFGRDVHVEGGNMIDRSSDITLSDTWRASDGSFGVTSVMPGVAKKVIRCELREPLDS